MEAAAQLNGGKAEDAARPMESTTSPPIKTAPKSWADLVRTKGAPTAPAQAHVTSDPIAPNDGLAQSKAGSLADALSSYSVKESSNSAKVAFLEPRGLVNTGNMCYMNSVSPLGRSDPTILLTRNQDITDFGFLCAIFQFS